MLMPIALTLALFTGTVDDPAIVLSPISTGAMPKMGGYRPQRLTLAVEKPATITKLPDGLSSPLYGVLAMGLADENGKRSRIYHVVLDEPAGKDALLLVDTNGNGDLTDDPALEWKKKTYKGQDEKEYGQYGGGATVELKYADATLPAHLGMYRFDPNDPTRAAMKDVVLFYADYAYEGELRLGDKKLKVLLVDDSTSGDFRGKADGKESGVRLLVDVNGNGKFESRGEAFDVRQPFNLGGTTYELSGLTASGASAKLVKSDKKVAEVAPPPDHGVGKKITPFTATTMDGKKVSFPSSFKGKVVMIDFWATWCQPCMKEMPNLVANYDKFHGQGFEVLGITLDQKDAVEKIGEVTKQQKMSWPQVYDGQGWKAEIAQLYVVSSIPAAYLVDGDTGEILAVSAQLRDERLEETLKKALERKNPKG